jgi:hypothetical protein
VPQVPGLSPPGAEALSTAEPTGERLNRKRRWLSLWLDRLLGWLNYRLRWLSL